MGRRRSDRSRWGELSLLAFAMLAASGLGPEARGFADPPPANADAEGPASPTVIPVWPTGAPGEAEGAGEGREAPAVAGDPTIRITDVGRPTLTVFRPPADKDTGAAVLICPGGGYRILAFDKEGTEIAEWLNSLGVTGIVLKYRVPAKPDRPRHEAPLQDAQRALGLIRRHASEWKIDPDRIGVLGFSAGGHLSAMLCSRGDERTYEPIDEADRASCRPNFALLIYPAYLATPEDALAPELSVSAATPPTFLLQTQDDRIRVECSLVYYAALTAAKVPAEMHLFPHGGHGYGLRPSKHAVSDWPRLAGRWLRTIGVLGETPEGDAR